MKSVSTPLIIIARFGIIEQILTDFIYYTFTSGKPKDVLQLAITCFLQ